MQGGSCGSLAVTLPATPSTLAPGEYVLIDPATNARTLIGGVLSCAAGTVTREVADVNGADLRVGNRYAWSGVIQATPREFSTEYRVLPAPFNAPAWHVPAPKGSTLWAVHLHGLGATASSTLRTVPLFSAENYHSVAVTYGASKPTQLGETEWAEAELAMDYAVQNGATSIVLIGWSMGAVVAQRLIRDSAHARLIEGVVLFAPLLSWEATIMHSAHKARIPTCVTRASIRLLETPKLSRLFGLTKPLRAADSAWDSGANPPTLIFHSVTDPTNPFSESARHAAQAGSRIFLVATKTAGHTLEWNNAPQEVAATISNWLKSLGRQ